MGKPYPLEVARELRATARQSAELQLGRAQRELARVRAEREALVGAAAAIGEARLRAQSLAAVSGAELALAGAHAARLSGLHAARREALARADRAVGECERTVRLAELTLTQACVELEVVERHHARFKHDQRKRAERALEEEQDDLLLHARHRQSD